MAQDDTSDPELAEARTTLSQLSQLTGWLAHEINNSLAAIHSSFALLQRLIPTDHPHYRYVGAIDREVARTTALTLRLQKGYDFPPGRANAAPLARAVGSALNALEPLRAARGVEVIARGPGPADPDPAVSTVAEAAIRHALQHAIESCTSSGGVRMEGREQSGRIVVDLSWTESESTAERLPRLAPPGFALALSHQLVAAVSGELIVAKQDGPGGAIRLLLPKPAPEE